MNFQEFCPYCGIPTCPHCGAAQKRQPGRPRKLLTEHERHVVKQLRRQGLGARHIAAAINQARREEWGDSAQQVTYWTTQREIDNGTE